MEDGGAVGLVERFCEAWSRLDIDELLGFLAPDAVYHNIPLAPVVGHDEIRATIERFTGGVTSVEFRMIAVAGSGSTVLTERLDVFAFEDGRAIELPVMGAFEVADGHITAWRDYFDMNQFMSQLQA